MYLNADKNQIRADSVIYDLDIADDEFIFNTTIASAISSANLEIQVLNERVESIKDLRPACDKMDYTLSACCGALCGVLDIFLVGKPNETPIGKYTDKWFEKKTIAFAKLCHWEPKKEPTLSNALEHLEKHFKVPYDQRGAGDAGKIFFDLSPDNHHFKSLAHNPSLLGLFFSIMDQWCNTSHFVTAGELITLVQADNSFQLEGHDLTSKLFCGFINWIGHLISDMSGSSSSKGRGMGIPSPFWTWTNDVIAIKKSLHLDTLEFDRAVNEIALNIYKEGFDSRFQTVQAIPVIINELLVRAIYSIRRLISYFHDARRGEHSFAVLWKKCEPFSNPAVKRMLTVAHGVFCLLDIGDATIRGFISGAGSFNPTEFFLRLNIVGVGRFTISLYGEGIRELQNWQAEQSAEFAKREITIIKSYIDGLKTLSALYDDALLLTFVCDLERSDAYQTALQKSASLAELRNVPEDKIMRTKSDVDAYFRRG